MQRQKSCPAASLCLCLEAEQKAWAVSAALPTHDKVASRWCLGSRVVAYQALQKLRQRGPGAQATL